MARYADFECVAHGTFEARQSGDTMPKCPRGCSRGLVRKVYLTPPAIGSARTRTADKLLREAAEMQGLSDISTSPSRPGGSVAERLRMKQRQSGMVGPDGRQYPAYAQAIPMPMSDMAHVSNRSNELQSDNFKAFTGGHTLGDPYSKDEWKKDAETGVSRHIGKQAPHTIVPTGSTGVAVERVKE